MLEIRWITIISVTTLRTKSYYARSSNQLSGQGCWNTQIFNASASSSSWSFMLPSSLSLPHLWNFLLPLPAPDRASRFRVRFRFQSFSSKCFRFHKNLTASTASASSFRFHISAQYETANCISFKKKQASLLCKLFYLTCVVERAWHGMEDDFSVFHTGNFRPFHFHSILKVFHSIFHSILKFSFIFHFILPYQRKCRLEAMQHLFCCFASLQCCKQPLVKVRQQY